MSKRYTGGVISSSLPSVTSAGASGLFTLSQQADAQSQNKWPPYKIEKSLRFRSSASASLSRTFISSNPKSWSFSAWVKRSKLASAQSFFISTLGGLGVPQAAFYFTSSDTIQVYDYTGSSYTFDITTSQVFRDTSAWYHLMLVYDSANATSSNRVRLYVNGSQITAFGSASYPTQNAECAAFNRAYVHYISQQNAAYFDGYMAEINFIDGQSLTPSSFGATDKDGIWSVIPYTGSYGSNGFYLNFKDITSTTTTGYDYSGNSNNWTLSGFNVATANTSYDIMIDVPSDQSDGNAYGGRGNYTTLNPLTFYNSQTTSISLSNGNLNIKAHTVNGDTRSFGTLGVSTGKWYFESNIVAVDSTYGCVGVSDIILAHGQGQSVGNWWVYIADGKKYNGVNPVLGGVSYGNTYTTNDVIGVAVDLDNGKIWFSKNGTYQASGDPVAGTNAAFTNVAGTIYPVVYTWAANSEQALNFGQRSFAYTPPAGFKALNTYNLPDPTIKAPNKHFDATLWTGNNGTQSIVNTAGFAPDLVWLKNRTTAFTHLLYDALRGAGTLKAISSSETTAEGGLSDNSTFGYLSALNSNGFTVVSGSTANSYTNSNSNAYVGWQWNAGGSTVTNTTGTISSQVRASTTAGFSIVKFSTGSAGNFTVGHGLGVTPAMFTIKRLNSTSHWDVWHKAFTTPATEYMYLNLLNAVASDSRQWANAAPTSTVFSGEAGYEFGTNSDFIAYCWSEIEGYSKFSSYTGNGSTDGPFVYTGFRPRFIMMKCSSTGGVSRNWAFIDTARSYANAGNHTLAANLSDASSNFGTGVDVFGAANVIDILSNGFKIRDTGVFANSSGGTYIYMAFAESPFKYSRAR